MIAHGKLIKSMYGPDVKVVFVGLVLPEAGSRGDDRTTGFAGCGSEF